MTLTPGDASCMLNAVWANENAWINEAAETPIHSNCVNIENMFSIIIKFI